MPRRGYSDRRRPPSAASLECGAAPRWSGSMGSSQRRVPVHARGVTYGSFRPRAGDGAHFAEREHLEQDFEATADAGFTVFRTDRP